MCFDTTVHPRQPQLLRTVVRNDSWDCSTVESPRWSVCKDITEGCVGAWLGAVELLRRQAGRQAGELQVSFLLSCYSDKVDHVSPSLLDVLFSNKYPEYLYTNLAPNSSKIINQLILLK